VATCARLHQRGYAVSLLPPWFDVDDAAGLCRLRQALTEAAIDAPETLAVLADIPP
jgi:glycosyltransferase A (GT-A) superfamily protein (DUF2064 family)